MLLVLLENLTSNVLQGLYAKIHMEIWVYAGTPIYIHGKHGILLIKTYHLLIQESQMPQNLRKSCIMTPKGNQDNLT